MISHLQRGALCALVTSASLVATSAATADTQALTAKMADLKLAQPLRSSTSGIDRRDGLDSTLRNAVGKQTVAIHLLDSRSTSTLSSRPAALRAAREGLQNRFIGRHAGRAAGFKVLARTQLVLNAVFVEVDATALKSLAADSAVSRITPVGDYQLDLSETVPYIGATAVQNLGFDGEGISVAVLDSGVDYTHAAFNGGGTLAAYEAAYGTSNGDAANTTRDGLFPTDRVVEGYDFVGEAWPNGDLAPDPDPIDFQGHGSNVADIIGGNLGVAPAVDLYAVKVCSAVSSSCSGIALIQGMEYAVDPNGDGSTDDHVDIINMSLGSNYGQPFDDDLALAVDNATSFGVLTVASAGNGSDRPYVTGTPAASDTALSVAQTQVPSASLQRLTVAGADYTAIYQSWSAPLEDTISAPIQFADGAGGNLTGCDPFDPDSLAGLTVLVDRGGCNFTTKIFNIANAGGVVGIIGLVAPGAPFNGGFADPGGPITAPGFMIDLADADAIRASIDAGNTDSVADPTNILPLVQGMVGSSSRGPRNFDNQLKPEIGAPGASLSAAAGSGDGLRVFGGTSGAAPMVAGSAALLIDATRDRGQDLPPAVLKALLINTGEIDISTDPFSGLAPVSRIGGGEVRIDRAVNAAAAAWESDTLQGALSFGFVDVVGTSTMSRNITVSGMTGDTATSWDITPSFRYADDEASGAVTVTVTPASVTLAAGDTAEVTVQMSIDGASLPGNSMSSGPNGADPNSLTANEYDGYLTFDNGEQQIRMPWHVLPRKSANTRPIPRRLTTDAKQTVALTNSGANTAQVDAYSLIAISRDIPRGGVGEQSPTPDIRSVGVKTIQVGAGFCSDNPSFLWIFAINSWERQTHLAPVSHQVGLDIDRDGNEDFVVLNSDITFGTLSDGRQGSHVLNTATDETSVFFFAEHATNTANTVLTICAEQIGMSAADIGTTTVDATVTASDFYFGGPGDVIDGLSITPGGERYTVLETDVAPMSSGSVDIIDNGEFAGNSDELGVLLFTNGDRGAGARGGASRRSEALILRRGPPIGPITGRD